MRRKKTQELSAAEDLPPFYERDIWVKGNAVDGYKAMIARYIDTAWDGTTNTLYNEYPYRMVETQAGPRRKTLLAETAQLAFRAALEAQEEARNRASTSINIIVPHGMPLRLPDLTTEKI